MAKDKKWVSVGGLGLHLMKNPAGTFSFVGRIPTTLAWVNKDGSTLTADEAKEITLANYPAMLGKRRVFEHPADAFDAAEELGFLIDSIDDESKAILAADGYLDEKDYGDRG